MSRQLKEDLEKLYESMQVVTESKMTAGNMKVGDLPGSTKKVGPAKSGSECTDADKAEEAPEKLQGDTVESSKKGKKGSVSKFQEFYRQIVSEELGDTDIESPSFDQEISDFPPAGPDEESAERSMEDDLGGEETVRDLFIQLGEIFTKLADKFEHEDSEIEDDGLGGEGEGDLLSDEPVTGGPVQGEAVESTPAPKSVAKLTSKGNFDSKGVKIFKKKVSSNSGGQEDGGKPKLAPKTNLNPKMPFKSKGSGAAVDGKDASAFE